jgi:hypothetical protein
MDEITARRIFKELEKIQEKQEEMKELQSALNIIVAKQEVNIADHIRRTALLEEEVLPIKAHVEQVRGVGKFIMYMSVVGATIAAILALK